MVKEGNRASGASGTWLPSAAALGSVIAATSCCLPVLPFVVAAGAAGGSAVFARLRPYLLAVSVFFIALGFYQARRAKRCRMKPSVLNMLNITLLWFSAAVVFVSLVFPQLIANLLAG